MSTPWLLIVSYVLFLFSWGVVIALFWIYQKRISSMPKERNIDVLNIEIKRLSDEVSNMSVNRDSLFMKIAKYESEIGELIKSLEKHKREHEGELHTYRQEKRVLVDKTSELREHVREREARLAEVNAEVAASERRREELTGTVGELAAEAERLRREREATGEALRALRRQLEETEKELFEIRRAPRPGSD